MGGLPYGVESRAPDASTSVSRFYIAAFRLFWFADVEGWGPLVLPDGWLDGGDTVRNALPSAAPTSARNNLAIRSRSALPLLV